MGRATGCCTGTRYSALISLLAGLCGVIGCAHFSGLKYSFKIVDATGLTSTEMNLYVGIWHAGSKVNDESTIGDYKCKDTAVFLNGNAGVIDAFSGLQADLLGKAADVVGEDNLDGNAVDGDGKRKRRDGDSDNDNGSGVANMGLLGEECQKGLKQRCAGGRVFSVWAVLFSTLCIVFGLAGKSQMWVGLFNFFAVLGYLVTMAVLVTMKGGDTDGDLKGCGTDGEWSYGIAFIVIVIAFVLQFASLCIALCCCRAEEEFVKKN